MQQRIRVIGIVERGEELLVLKRMTGRSLEAPKYELPTTKIFFGEQPEEALGRAFLDYTGVSAEEVKLKDVVTFTYLDGASQVGNLYILYSVKIKENEQIKVNGDRYTAYKWVKYADTSAINLEDASSNVLRIMHEMFGHAPSSARDVANSAVIYVDGGSRGNPGPAGIGYYIVNTDGGVMRRGGEFIGFNSSRIAEYFALKEGLEQAIELGLKEIRIMSDSLMVVNQMKGIYKVKNRDLDLIYDDIQVLLKSFDAWDIMHVPRAENTIADKEANKAIDAWHRRTVDNV